MFPGVTLEAPNSIRRGWLPQVGVFFVGGFGGPLGAHNSLRRGWVPQVAHLGVVSLGWAT